jgi:hypothetical protein
MGQFLAILIFCISLILLVLAVLSLRGKIHMGLRTILIFSVLLRLALIVLYVNITHYDVYSYKIVGDATLLGNNIYPEQAEKYHPYLPFMLYIEALAVLFSGTGFSHMLFMKLFFSFFDVLNIVLMYLVSNRNSKIAFLYAVHPAFMYLAAVHGQIDQISVSFILLAIYLLQKKKEALSAIMFGAGIMVKTWPLILMLLFVKYAKRRLVYIAGAAMFPISSILTYAFFYNANIIDIVRTALSYKGFASWGLGMIVAEFTGHIPEKLFLLVTDMITTDFIVALMLVFLAFSLNNIVKEVFLFLLVFSIFSLRGANPIWLLPFVILVAPKFSSTWIVWFGVYSAMISLGEVVDTYKLPMKFLQEIWKVNTVALWILQLAMLFSYTPQMVNLVRRKIALLKTYLQRN